MRRGAAGGALFCFGLGYTGLGLASFLRHRGGWQVVGTCRSEENAAALALRGFRAFHFDPANGQLLEYDLCHAEFLEQQNGEGLESLGRATHVLSSIPPIGNTACDPVCLLCCPCRLTQESYALTRSRIILDMHEPSSCWQQVLATHALDLEVAHQDQMKWLGYLSTTGVYGDWEGDWVDESSLPRRVDTKMATRIAAEASWLELGQKLGVPAHIFRLGGIYGPSRSALDTIVRQRDQCSAAMRLREKRRYTSRCHVLAICQVVAASMEAPMAGRIYNIVDDDPAPRSEVMAFAKTLLNEACNAEPQQERDESLMTGHGSSCEGNCLKQAAVREGEAVCLTEPQEESQQGHIVEKRHKEFVEI
eukprot:SM000080S22951  [mRNA]  locus=s80:281897:284869:+ [translate_table: standard]